MMGQGKSGWWLAGICAAVVLTSIGYGMGRRAALKSLGADAGMTSAGAPLPSIQIEPIQPQEELAAIHSAASTATQAAAPQAPAILPDQAASSQPQAVEAGNSGDMEESARVQEIQLALKAAGFDPGPADGRMGPRTRSAVRDFQLAHGLQADGKVGPRTWDKLETFLKSSSAKAE